MGQLNIAKLILGILILGNVIFFGYNAYSAYERSGNENAKRAQNGAVKIKQEQVDFRKDLKKITAGNIIKIGRASEHFQKKARELGFDTTRDLYIPSEPAKKPLSNFSEETWKIAFSKKNNRPFSFSDVARLGNVIEQSAPGFQVKEIDFGKRVDAYGKDAWNPGYIMIRRLERKRTSR